MRIYVACLASYNAGTLHGEWIDIEGKDYAEVMEEIQAILKASPEQDAEEWAIHDHEGFDGLDVSEYHDIQELVDYSEAITKSGHDPELISGVMDNLGIGVSEAIEYISDNYCGQYDSLEDWAEGSLDDMLSALPESLRGYFDYASYARDFELDGRIFTIENGRNVHVLWSA
jgi:antirestriction protein